MTLTEFLLARISEDEAEAKSATVRVAAPNWLAAFREDDGQRTLVIDPDRLLAECEAKRRIVELHGPHGADASRLPCRELASIAAVYADHPDYDESWRP